MSNIDEYEKILLFLESQKPIKKKVDPAPTSKKEVQVKEKKQSKKEKASIDTKKLIESSQIHSDLPGRVKFKDSEGFDVSAFEAMMRAKLIDNHKKMQSYERPYISVTELCSCLRQAYYSRSKYPIDLKKMFQFSYLYMIQEVGNMIHSIILGLYNFTETEKTIVSEKYKVKGRIDGLRDRFLHEIKSIDENKFKGTFLDDHYDQAACYAHILNTEYDGYDIDTIVLTYVMRNCKRIVPFDVPVKPKLAESLLKRAPILLSSLKSKNAPDPLGAKMDHCKYCLYRKYCEQDECDEIYQPFAEKKKEKDTSKKQTKRKVFLM